MPTYEYQCGACGAKFEQFQRMSDDPIKICPQCGESSVKRLMSTGVGVVFKGSGFYVTDYRDASYSKAESADRTNTAPAASSSNDSSSTSNTTKVPSSATSNPPSAASSGGDVGNVPQSGVTGGTTSSGGTPNTSTHPNSGNASKAA